MTNTAAAAAEDAPPAVASDDDDQTSMDEHDLRQWLPRKQMLLLDKYLQELRLSRLTAPQPGDTSHNNRLRTAHQTVNLLRHLIGSSNVAWRTAADLLRLLRALGRVLQEAAGPREPSVANLVRRVMAAVREEALREAQEAAAADKQQATTTMPPPSVQTDRLSLQTMLWALPQHVRSSSRRRGKSFVGGTAVLGRVVEGGVVQRQESLASEAEMMESNSSAGGAGRHHHHHPFPESFYATRPNLKQAVLEAMQEIITDLEDLHRNINEQVVHHIHAGEIILTIGDDSQTVESFLKAAHAKQQQSSGQHGSNTNTNPFTVLVCGGNSAMASRLAAAGIDTTHMETAAVFAIMPRVHKVLLPAYAVLANGGLVAQTGANLVALAAHHQQVPVVCVTGLYKLCPLYPHEGQDTVLQDLGSPVPELARDFAELHDDDCWDGVELINPRHDYIQPQHISLYITNVGSFQPSFIYRLLAENYHSDDWESFIE